MSEEVKKIKQKLRQEEDAQEEEMAKQEDEIAKYEYEVKLLWLWVKEKKQEQALGTLKTKELKRQLWYNTLKPLKTKSQNLTSEVLSQPLTIRNVKKHDETLKWDNSEAFTQRYRVPPGGPQQNFEQAADNFDNQEPDEVNDPESFNDRLEEPVQEPVVE